MLRSWGGRGGGGNAVRGEQTDVIVPATALDPWDVLRRELDRARRYARPLALIQIAPHAAAAAAPPEDLDYRRRTRRFRRHGRSEGDSVTYLRALVRTGDEVWRVHDRIFVMLPEADFECATNMVERLKSRAPHIVGGSDLRIAAFPEDGVTAGALLATLARGSAGRTRFTPDTARPKGPREVSTPRTTDEAWLRRSGRSRGMQ
jgi:hypothetical protein